jgi:thiol-disulfide isomerase/thioredoxin
MNLKKYLNRFLLLPVVASTAFVTSTAIGADAGPSRSSVSAGQLAPVFQAKTLDGKTVNFPGDYKGKVVLLDFWATWCGPCRAELPKVVDAYSQYHDKGFEILSVSLDRPRQGPELLEFTKTNNITWPQIYDGGYWKAKVAVQYGVRAIPCPVLVDGDTGQIIATDADALGDRLTSALDKALVAKGRKAGT